MYLRELCVNTDDGHCVAVKTFGSNQLLASAVQWYLWMSVPSNRICRFLRLPSAIEQIGQCTLDKKYYLMGKTFGENFDFCIRRVVKFGRVPNPWCNRWLNYQHGRQNHYVVARFKMNNVFHALLLYSWRDLDTHWCTTPQAAYRKWPIQITEDPYAEYVRNCCWFIKYCLPYRCTSSLDKDVES